MIMEISRKEELLIIAIRNLMRKQNFRDLHDATEKYFDAIIDANPNKYTIKQNLKISETDIELIYEIVKEIGFDIIDLSVKGIAEMFSITNEDLINSNNKFFNEQFKSHEKV
jgi:hypothetical protein